MTVKHEIREERSDIYSFWEIKKQLNGSSDAIIEVDEKIEETTILELEKRIIDLQKEIKEYTAKIILENSKIDLINLLK